MFWRITGLSTASPVDNILDKENYTLEELLDEDEIIQECKAHNSRLISFLQQKTQVAQLLHYIVEEAPDDAEKNRTFKFPFIACEVFTCEVDSILESLVEDEELMNLLFSFLQPDHSHSTLMAGYFSKVVVCLLLRKTVPFMNFVQGHQEIFHQLVDLIGITSIMEVLIRLIGADEHVYSKCVDSMRWLEEINVLEMIVDKFSSSDSPEVHANVAEILCATTRYARPGLTAKISSPSFVGRLFHHALEDSRPTSVLFHSLTVCISLLDPKRLVSSSYYTFPSQLTHGSPIIANPETIDGMLERLGDLLKLLAISSSDSILPTTYGRLQPPLGKLRLKIVEFVSVLLTIRNESAEKELIRLGAIQRILDLFFEYPFNNFLHHHVEDIVASCLESKGSLLIEHLLNDCGIVDKILEAEKNFNLSADPNKPTVPAEGRVPPRIGNIGHITRISNRLNQLANTNSVVQTHLQGNVEWTDWYRSTLLKRNAVENVFQWTCGRPNALQDRTRDSDDEDFKIRDYDVAAMANDLTRAFRYDNYNSDDIEEAPGSLEQDDEDVYFDDESAEVVISSLRLGDDQESSLFTNSNWFAFEDSRVRDERTTSSIAQAFLNSDEMDEVVVGENDELENSTESGSGSKKAENGMLENGPSEEYEELRDSSMTCEVEKPPEWVEWRETLDSGDGLESHPGTVVPNGELEVDDDDMVVEEASPVTTEPLLSVGNTKDENSGDGVPGPSGADSEDLPESSDVNAGVKPSGAPEPSIADVCPETSCVDAETRVAMTRSSPQLEDGR